MASVIDAHKVCTACGESKPLSEYNKKSRFKRRTDGTEHRWTSSYAECKPCWYKRNKANAGKYTEYYKQYREENRDRINKQCRDHYVKNKTLWAEFLASVIDLKCVRCGYDRSLAALDFHHLDPSNKDFNIHDLIKYSNVPSEERKAMVVDELAKCEVICANCHREEHEKYSVLK